MTGDWADNSESACVTLMSNSFDEPAKMTYWKAQFSGGFSYVSKIRILGRNVLGPWSEYSRVQVSGYRSTSRYDCGSPTKKATENDYWIEYECPKDAYAGAIHVELDSYYMIICGVEVYEGSKPVFQLP